MLILTYGSESWTLREQERYSIHTTESERKYKEDIRTEVKIFNMY